MNLFPHGIKALSTAACSFLSALVAAEPVEQDTIEAAMTMQILEFTEWPDNQPDPKTIGVVNSADSMAAFEALLEDPRYKDRYTISAITSATPREDLIRCSVLFFGNPDPIEVPRILRKLDNEPIVLVGTFDGFFAEGGLVNLLKKQRRLGFEIQLDNSNKRGIEYRAKLLRLATRIVQE